jgi:hypothetical protein
VIRQDLGVAGGPPRGEAIGPDSCILGGDGFRLRPATDIIMFKYTMITIYLIVVTF